MPEVNICMVVKESTEN